MQKIMNSKLEKAGKCCVDPKKPTLLNTGVTAHHLNQIMETAAKLAEEDYGHALSPTDKKYWKERRLRGQVHYLTKAIYIYNRDVLDGKMPTFEHFYCLTADKGEMVKREE
tara:strand:+ start:135 stop:467 length:333 start_codon:yes stop_codon:yes gene_type:complete